MPRSIIDRLMIPEIVGILVVGVALWRFLDAPALIIVGLGIGAIIMTARPRRKQST